MTDAIDDIEERLDRLESLVEKQQETIQTQRERIAKLEADDEAAEDDTNSAISSPVSRRDALTAGGLLAVLVGGVGTASADAQGQIGTSNDPLRALYTAELNGDVTGDQALTDLFGDGLTLSGTALAADPGNGVGLDGDGRIEVPAGAIGSDELALDSVTISAGDGLTGGGDVSLGGASTLDVAPTDFAGRNLTASGGDLDYVPPENVLVVARSGGDYTTVSGALDSIGDNAADNPYVVRVAPGVYDEKVELKSHVDVVGSGVHATSIETTQTNVSNATLQGHGATDAEVRRLTVQGDAAALDVDGSGTDVAVKQARIRQDNDAQSIAVNHSDGTLRLRNCLVEAKSSSSDGIAVYGGTVDVSHCRVEGTQYAIWNQDATVNVRHSQLIGGSLVLTNTFSVCDGSYNGI